MTEASINSSGTAKPAIARSDGVRSDDERRYTAREIARLVTDLRKLISDPDSVIDEPAEMTPFETDGYTIKRQLPLAVVLPANREEIAAVLKYCHRNSVKVVPRGSGTSLSGGAIPCADGILMVLSKLNKILSVDLDQRYAVVQPGVINLQISKAVAEHGLFYAPDPSSQAACSVGGNVAENSGGLHCLKYGLTMHNVLALECVLMNGEVLRVGGIQADHPGLDLLAVLIGSEGMLAVITEITVRLLVKPQQAKAMLIGFDNLTDAAACVAAIIKSGVIPAAMEMLDQQGVIVAEKFVSSGYPTDVAALLLVEVDGLPSDVIAAIKAIRGLATSNNASHFEVSENEQQRLQFWNGRKAAFPAAAAVAADFICMDGSIPRNCLADVLTKITEISSQFDIPVINVFHAGDGNLHPLILFDVEKPGDLQKAEQVGDAILKYCVEVGGVLSGEHGIGLEKKHLMPSQFTPEELNLQQRLKCAFDEQHLLNPGKVFPTLPRCADLGWMHVHRGKIPFPHIPRF